MTLAEEVEAIQVRYREICDHGIEWTFVECPQGLQSILCCHHGNRILLKMFNNEAAHRLLIIDDQNACVVYHQPVPLSSATLRMSAMGRVGWGD